MNMWNNNELQHTVKINGILYTRKSESIITGGYRKTIFPTEE